MKHRSLAKAAISTAVLLFSIYGCRPATSPWSDSQMWYSNTEDANPEYADVFYLVSTRIFHEENADGSVLYVASNTPEQKAVLSKEMAHVSNNLFPDSLNFFSPFYHQLTMEAAGLDSETYLRMSSDVTAEVYESFRYYMDNLNGGRPVVLAGFSQGAFLVKKLLKMMPPEDYSKIVASYSLGCGVNDGDASTGRIIPAQGADDTGVCISFNSVSDTSAIWPLAMDKCSHCINPVSWTVGAESAEFSYDGQDLTVRLDTSANVLVVNGYKESAPVFNAPWPEGCLHRYEILFYNDYLRSNVLRRVNNFRKSL